MINFAEVYNSTLNQLRGITAEKVAGDESNLNRRISQNEIQRSRDHQFALQDNELSGRRQLASDQFAYQYSLANQGYDADMNRDLARFQHDDELFERQRAGRWAEQQLEMMQANQMAQFQAGQQEQRDYRLNEFDAARQSNQQEFQRGMAEYDAGQQEQRDYRMADINSQQLGQQQEFQAGLAGFEAEKQMRAQIQQQMSAANLQLMAHKGRMAEDEVMQRHEDGRLDRRYKLEAEQWKARAQDDYDKEIVKGLEEGKLQISSPRDRQQLLANANERAEFRNDKLLSPEQRKAAMEASFQHDAEIRRSAMPPPPEERAQSREKSFQGYVSMLDPSERNKPWQLNKEGNGIELPRGWKPEVKLPPPMSADQHKAELGNRIITHSDGSQWYADMDKNGRATYKPVPPPKATAEKEKADATFRDGLALKAKILAAKTGYMKLVKADPNIEGGTIPVYSEEEAEQKAKETYADEITHLWKRTATPGTKGYKNADELKSAREAYVTQYGEAAAQKIEQDMAQQVQGEQIKKLSVEEAKKLPPNTWFYDKDGVHRKTKGPASGTTYWQNNGGGEATGYMEG